MGRQEIISQLVEARLEKGITQAELARMIGTQRSNLVMEIMTVNEANRHLMPLDMELSGEGILHWLERIFGTNPQHARL